MKKVAAVLGIMLILLIAALMVDAIKKDAARTPEQAAEQAAAEKDRKMSASACYAAQEAVKSKLKAPATAEFPGCIWAIYEYRITADQERKSFIVSGHVDAQNSFGAKLRNNFITRLTVKENHSPGWPEGWPDWDVVSVAID